ncbi:MAG: non-heme iron oxygenase ferredoxin subunit [Actinomycetota bacterium]|nr:non-heme iron oxygenase ferredoxin subunit [Actinomycetota bacterium]
MSNRIDAGSVDEFDRNGGLKKVSVGSHDVVVVRIEDDFYAIGDKCSHADISLSEGDVYVEDCEIECWKHGSTFSLKTGKPQTLPATKAVPVYEVVVEDQRVVVIA